MPWDRPITTLGADIRDQYRADVRDVAFTALGRLQQRAPVDTGHFRSRWQVEQQGDDWVVFNDAPYAQRLEEGHSSQAPNGFLDITIAELQVLA